VRKEGRLKVFPPLPSTCCTNFSPRIHPLKYSSPFPSYFKGEAGTAFSPGHAFKLTSSLDPAFVCVPLLFPSKSSDINTTVLFFSRVLSYLEDMIIPPPDRHGLLRGMTLLNPPPGKEAGPTTKTLPRNNPTVRFHPFFFFFSE